MITRTNNVLAWWKIGPFSRTDAKTETLKKLGLWNFFPSCLAVPFTLRIYRLWFFTVNMYLICCRLCEDVCRWTGRMFSSPTHIHVTMNSSSFAIPSNSVGIAVEWNPPGFSLGDEQNPNQDWLVMKNALENCFALINSQFSPIFIMFSFITIA